MLENLIADIRKALAAELYYAALQSTLTLPDICGNVDYPGEKNGKRYKDWYGGNVRHGGAQSHWFGGDQAWQMRNAALHDLNPPAQELAQFHPSARMPLVYYAGLKNSALEELGRPHMIAWARQGDPYVFVINPAKYCEEVLSAVEGWLALARREPDKSSRLDRIMQIELPRDDPNFSAPAWALIEARKYQPNP